jgi:hypothetical protein
MGYDVINCLQLDNLTAIVLELELEFNTQCYDKLCCTLATETF